MTPLDDERRRQLVRRSAELREQLASASASARPAFRAADYVADGIHWLRHHPALPVLLISAVIGALASRPRTLWRLGAGALCAWHSARRARPVLHFIRRSM